MQQQVRSISHPKHSILNSTNSKSICFILRCITLLPAPQVSLAAVLSRNSSSRDTQSLDLPAQTRVLRLSNRLGRRSIEEICIILRALSLAPPNVMVLLISLLSMTLMADLTLKAGVEPIELPLLHSLKC